MILPSADLVNDRWIVLSGLDRIWRFYIHLDSEKKQLCNSSLRKSTNHLICYLDLIILQKFDPILLQALFGNLFPFNEIYPLKCSTSKKSYFFGMHISFLLSSSIYIHFFSEASTYWNFTLKCSTTQGFPVCACLVSNLFIFIAKPPRKNFHENFSRIHHSISNFDPFSFPWGTTSLSTEYNDGCVGKCGIHSPQLVI